MKHNPQIWHILSESLRLRCSKYHNVHFRSDARLSSQTALKSEGRDAARTDKSSMGGSGGFTILELLIATVVFSVVLLLCATAIVQVGRMYYKTTLLVRVTDTTRAVSDDVSQAIQFGMVTNGFYRTGGVPGGVQSVCLGSIRYTFAPPSASLGTGAGQMRHTLWKDRGGGAGPCTPVNLMVNTPSSLGQELLGNDMRVSLLDIRQGTRMDGTPDPAGIWTINIIIAYGSGNDLFVPASNYQTCVESIVGGQFCAVSRINTNATKRL